MVSYVEKAQRDEEIALGVFIDIAGAFHNTLSFYNLYIDFIVCLDKKNF